MLQGVKPGALDCVPALRLRARLVAVAVAGVVGLCLF